MNKRRTGADWERLAAQYLTGKGMRMLETNFRCRQGEIDLIGVHQGYLVFVEVKYRSSTGTGYALEAVDYRKQCRICRVADYYRYTHGYGEDVSVRYDVVGVQGRELEWVQNAFAHIYTRR
ncbi:MAG: YraN family protein [Lachnospiraceae bacterium]|nr:YraN family protein [Lachnospiraceae bacterium]